MHKMKTLKQAYKDYFTVGAAVAASWLDEASETVKDNFDTITAENEMKYNGVHPHNYPRPDFSKLKRGEKPPLPEITDRERFVHPSLETDTAPADKIYNFAKDNGIALRGHTLSWHGSYPYGIFEQLTPQELMTNTIEHYEFMAEHFPGCYCWDVVNEAIQDKPGGYLRNTVYKEKFGDDYLYTLYGMARKHFPDAELCCNDYNEFMPSKRDNILKLVGSLKERGLVDVIGCQCHINAFFGDKEFDDLRRALDMYAETGLKIHITEMDVNCVKWDGGVREVTDEAVKNVPKVYARAFEIFRQYKGAIENVTFWGVSNRHSWLNSFKLDGAKVKNQPLMFDEDYRPTEAYLAVVDF